MFDSLDISASGLTAQRVRMDTIAANVASINVPKYRRRFAVLAPGRADDPTKPGVHVAKMDEDRGPFRRVPDPHRPGEFLEMPNVDLAVEIVNAIEASRAYEANVTAMEVTKSMLNASLRLLA